MIQRISTALFFICVVTAAFIAGTLTAQEEKNLIASSVISLETATLEKNDWGNFYTYYSGESYGTKDVLTGIAVIKAGKQIHPPHTHAEEEYLMITEGQGTWHLNGKEFHASKGDILYAAPWDVHGILNSSDKELTFVVWKWNNKGMALPETPEN